MLASTLSPIQRRTALLVQCRSELHKARQEYALIQEREGDGFMEAMEEAIREGGEGGVQVRLFELLKTATGKGKKIKWRGQKQEGKTRWKGRCSPPVLLSSLYKDGDSEKGEVITGAGNVLAETRKQAAGINGAKESFPAVAEQLMQQLRPFPEQHEPKREWSKEVCTWERFERAVGRAGADVGVGSDGYSGYLTRKASLPARRLYFDILRDMLEKHDFPPAWKLWECVLLMKPGEDPRELGRRRDIWLMPHSLKVAARMLMCEYEEACGRHVPSSQAGFTQNVNAPGQTLVMRLHRERCRERRQGYYVAYADMGTYFMSICKEVMEVAERWSGTRVEVSKVLLAMQEGLKGRVETAYGMTEPHDMPGVACGQGHECSPSRSKIMASFIQTMAQRVCRGYRFGHTGIAQVWFADDSAYLCEDIAGVQMALDAMWVVARVAGLKVTVKAKDAETRVGSKTAWMGTYWDEHGSEREVKGWEIKLPDGTVVPQVRAYKYLGTPLQIENQGRHEAMRKKVIDTCCGLIRQIGRVDMLGPRQLRRGFELAMAGVMGYYCRSTPMTWKGCQQIEAVRAEVMARRNICASTPRAAIYLPGEAGGAGHMHAYQYAAAAYIDQFNRALGGGLGEPVRTAVSERVAETCKRLGCTQAPLTWHPTEIQDTLSEDHMVEAWLLMKIRARLRGVPSDAMVHTSLSNCGACSGWRQRTPGSAPSCLSTLCPGSMPARADATHVPCDKTPAGQVFSARRTAACFGGWEYLVDGGKDQHRKWIPHSEMPTTTEHQARLRTAQQDRRQSHSLRDLLQTLYGHGKNGSVGKMEIAISGKKTESQTEHHLAELVNAFITHAQDQMADEMGDERWPNLEEVPLREGLRGSKWTQAVQPKVSYYRGGRETLPDGIERSCMSLQGRPGTWEDHIPDNMRTTLNQVETSIQQGDPIPEGGVHQHVNFSRSQPPGTGPWSGGSDQSGYSQINHTALREDPITRLFLRNQEFEQDGVTVQTRKGTQVTCGEANRSSLCTEKDAHGSGNPQGHVESMRALLDVCLPLHYSTHFTHAAAVDGSMDDPRLRGGKGKKRVAYGVYEGIRPEAEVESITRNWKELTQAKREQRCLGYGMWGGALPKDWDNNDAEAYAIMRYLQAVVERTVEPADQRVLVLSDSRVVLDVIESVWRTGDATLCKARDRGAMIEAVCEARSRLQSVVFVWCPGHRGVVPNECADMAAKAHLDEPVDGDMTERIAKSVRTRDCLYEMGSDHDEGTWSLLDRRCFKMARHTMGRWVQNTLLSSVHTLRYDAALADGRRHNYGEGGYCTEVVKDFASGRKVTPKSGVACMLDDCARVGFVMGRRARDSGLPHERGYLRRLGHEGPTNDDEAGEAQEECSSCEDTGGVLTALQREQRQGCPGCYERHVTDACRGCGGWLGRPAGAAPPCTRQECPGTSDRDGWILVRNRRARAVQAPIVEATATEEPSTTEATTREDTRATQPTQSSMWMVQTHHTSAVKLKVNKKGKVKLTITPAHQVTVKLQLKASRSSWHKNVTLRVSSVQARREERKQDEDPQHSIRSHDPDQVAWETQRSARSRQAQTTTERLRREGAKVHEDSRFEIVGSPRPLADLRHVIGACAGTPERLAQVEHLVYAARKLRDAVPTNRTDTQEFRSLTDKACRAFESSASGHLTEEGWESADRVLAAMVPDFAREAPQEERAIMIAAVIKELTEVHTIAAGLLGSWKRAH